MPISLADEYRGPGSADPGKTRHERSQELQGLLRTLAGKDIIAYYFLKYTGVSESQMPPVGLLMIQTILDHEYPTAKWRQ